MAVFVTVASGFNVSSQFTLERDDRPLAVTVPSMSGNVVRIAFATASGGTFGVLWDPAAADTLISSSTIRPATAIVEIPPSPWGRISTAVNVTDTVSVTLVALNRRL